MRGGESREPLTLALLYLLAHFPGDRDRILAATADLPIDADERSRLERGLAELDLENPDVGWVWPAPSAWDLSEEDAAHARATVRGLSRAGHRELGERHPDGLGVRRRHRQLGGAQRPTRPARRAPRTRVATQQACDGTIDMLFDSRAELLRCPTCQGPIALGDSGARCEPCATSYLAAGAGRWTEVVVDAVGAERLIAVDMMLPMLNVLRERLPKVPAVMGSALNLPFADGSVGAINLWNALQAIAGDRPLPAHRRHPHDDDVPVERRPDRPLLPGVPLLSQPAGHLVFEVDQLRQWLADAGLAVREETADVGTFVFVTAERLR